MKQLIAMIVILSLIGGGAYAYMLHYQRAANERAYETGLTELQRQFTERLGPVRAIEETAGYEQEISSLLRWYFTDLQRLKNRYPGHGDPMRVMEDFEEARASGQMDAQDFEQYSMHFEYVKWVFDRLEGGDFGVFLTGNSGNLRFDIHDIDRDRFEGQPQIRADFILWGAPRNIEERQDRGVTVRSVNVPVHFSRLFFQFLNDQGHIHGEMSASSGEPYLKIVHPERWIPEFPPMALLGRYWIDLFPDEAENFLWELDLLTTTTSGNRVRASYRWEMEIPRPWQVGGDWGGVETYRDEEYIQRGQAQ